MNSAARITTAFQTTGGVTARTTAETTQTRRTAVSLCLPRFSRHFTFVALHTLMMLHTRALTVVSASTTPDSRTDSITVRLYLLVFMGFFSLFTLDLARRLATAPFKEHSDLSSFVFESSALIPHLFFSFLKSIRHFSNIPVLCCARISCCLCLHL